SPYSYYYPNPQTGVNMSFIYNPGAGATPPKTHNRGINVLYVNSQVEWVPFNGWYVSDLSHWR
ncbi:MAG: hypothetical protein KAG97_03225, partial [Victivallales bacterium]|nr:hypothetical protein [Victivallales bacterium]